MPTPSTCAEVPRKHATESNRAANRIMVGMRLLGPRESGRRHTSEVGSWPSNFPIIGSDIQPGTSSDANMWRRSWTRTSDSLAFFRRTSSQDRLISWIGFRPRNPEIPRGNHRANQLGEVALIMIEDDLGRLRNRFSQLVMFECCFHSLDLFTVEVRCRGGFTPTRDCGANLADDSLRLVGLHAKCGATSKARSSGLPRIGDPQRASGPEEGIIATVRTRASPSYEDHFSN